MDLSYTNYMNEEELINKTNIQKIAQNGAEIYEKIKANYEPLKNGTFLAIEVDSEKIYEGSTAAEALVAARTANPGKLFYVVKVGSGSAETLAHSLVGQI